MTSKSRPHGVEHYETSVRAFSGVVSDGRERASRLAGPQAGLEQDPDALRVALEELRVHQEELAVADEELRAQLDELSSATTRARTERDRYRELFEASPDGYVVSDPFGVVREVNAATAAMLHIEMRFLVGKPLVSFIDGADKRTVRDAIDAMRSAPDVAVSIEVRLRPRNADALMRRVKAISIERGAALLWMVHDPELGRRDDAGIGPSELRTGEPGRRISELERALRDKDDLLQRERGLRKQLEDSHAAKDRFLAVLSHDLRAPLNAVLGWTQLLRREKLDVSSRDRALATIERSARAQARLVEELLDVSRIAADKVQIERLPIDLAELVERAGHAFAPSAEEQGVELVIRAGGELSVVSGDRRRLERVLTNLLSNALKFTPRAGQVAVSLIREDGWARVLIADTGRGIAPDLLPHIFEPFRQRDDYLTSGQGLGLGLYIVRQAVEMHGGKVTVESAGPDQGTCVTVSLPLATGMSSAAHAGSDADLRAAAPAELAGLRVLIVDDDGDSRDLTNEVLQRAGALVTATADVVAAIRAFDAAPPDVVVSDIGMPERDGLDLVRELRTRRSGSVAFVALSGFAAPEEVDRALAAGFDAHLAKPAEPAELVEVVRNAAARAR